MTWWTDPWVSGWREFRMLVAEVLLRWAVRAASPRHPDSLTLVRAVDRYFEEVLR